MKFLPSMSVSRDEWKEKYTDESRNPEAEAYLQFEPSSLLALPFGKDDFSSVTGALTMKNLSSHRVAYKFRTNYHEAYRIRPASGLISSNEVLEFEVQLLAGHHSNPNDILEIVSVPLDDNQSFSTNDKDEIRNLFQSAPSSEVQRHVIGLTQGNVTSDSSNSAEKSPVEPLPWTSKQSSIWSFMTSSTPSIRTVRRHPSSKVSEPERHRSSKVSEPERQPSSKISEQSEIERNPSSKISEIKHGLLSKNNDEERRESSNVNLVLLLILVLVLILVILNTAFFWKFCHEMSYVYCRRCIPYLGRTLQNLFGS